ncbi:MAG: exodeoxyribonuclease V subunit gamma [Chloroflexi bacterium]|nr:exodeoxyribonuclease V subunit gamma [Chloroflexota bacterium]
MSVELLCAPPACGKTRACIQHIQALRAHKPMAAVRIVVPDRLQADAFLRRLAASGGAIGTAVGTFGGLYREILQHAGRVVPLISAPLAHRLVQEAVEAVYQAGELNHYQQIHALPGFHQALGEAFAELKRAMVDPADLRRYAAGETPAQQELARIYARYQARLQELDWADQEGYSWLAVAALRDAPRLACCYDLLVFDGFDTFNAAQRRALCELAVQAGEMVITLPLTPGSERAAERRFTRNYDKLINELNPRVTTLPAAPRLPADLHYIQQSFLAGSPARLAHAEHIELLQARSPAEEAREALRWLKARVVRDGIPLNDCALFTPDLDIYRPLLCAAAREYGIPLKFTQYDVLSRSPALAALLNFLAIPTSNYETRVLFKALHSPYLKLGLTTAQVDQLEVISRAAQVVEGREQWTETWQRLIPAALVEAKGDDVEEDLPNLPHGQDAAALQQALDNAFALLQPLDGEFPLRSWVEWLEKLFDKAGFSAQAREGSDKLAYDAFREVLRALVATESVAGEKPVAYAGFLAQLTVVLLGAPLPEAPSPREGALLVGRMLEARGVRFRAAAILGLSEGIFPIVEHPDPLLDEALRRTLDLEPRLEREQAGLFYQALARADERLLLTRPYLAEGGEDWEESPYWLEIRRLLPDTVLHTIHPDDPRPLAEAASSQELLFTGVRRGDITGYPELDERFERLSLAREVLRGRRIPAADGPYEGGLNRLADAFAQRYAMGKPWSASRLEYYGTCPYYFYVKDALALEPCVPPEVGYNAAQLGSMLHEILEVTYATSQNSASLEALLAALPSAAEQVFANAPRKYGFRPGALWDFQCAEHTAMLEETITALNAASDGWTPAAFESAFGYNEAPPLRIELEAGPVHFHGFIDRIDRSADGKVRIIDYKTGSSHLANTDLLSGRRLQLPLYALAARDALGYGEPSEGFYWKIQEGASALKLSGFTSPLGSGMGGAVSMLLAHLERIMSGICAGSFAPVPPHGGCPDYCPAVHWCWRYQTSGW